MPSFLEFLSLRRLPLKLHSLTLKPHIQHVEPIALRVLTFLAVLSRVPRKKCSYCSRRIFILTAMKKIRKNQRT